MNLKRQVRERIRMMPLRLVQVGMGGWGQDWASVFAQHADVEMVACVGMQADALEGFRERHDFPVTACFSSLEGALEQSFKPAGLSEEIERVEVGVDGGVRNRSWGPPCWPPKGRNLFTSTSP